MGINLNQFVECERKETQTKQKTYANVARIKTLCYISLCRLILLLFVSYEFHINSYELSFYCTSINFQLLPLRPCHFVTFQLMDKLCAFPNFRLSFDEFRMK